MSDTSGALNTSADDELRFEVINHVGVITLNRPKALNALSHGMMRAFMPLLDQCEHDGAIHAVLIRGTGPKAFCAGGDVVAVVRSAREGSTLQRDFFIDEYRVDHRLHRFAKPVAVLMHGIVMGGGMGLSQGAALRLATDSTRIAMPETRIGLIPDVGATHFFGRMPAPLALYLGLTGLTIGPDDALFVGFADARSAVAEPDALDAALAHIAWPGDGQYSTRLHALRHALAATEPLRIDAATLPAHCAAIYRHFDPAHSVAEIVHALQATADTSNHDAVWARATLDLLRNRSPLMLAVCREALLRGRRMTLGACFRQEFDAVGHAIASGELIEGVRAFLIDKDQAPRWQLPTIEAVEAEHIARFFEPAAHDAAAHPLRDLQP